MGSPLRSGILRAIYGARKEFNVFEVFLQKELATLAKMKDFMVLAFLLSFQWMVTTLVHCKG